MFLRAFLASEAVAIEAFRHVFIFVISIPYRQVTILNLLAFFSKEGLTVDYFF